jgi:hypothetical protein
MAECSRTALWAHHDTPWRGDLMARSLALNGIYVGYDDGTATWSESLALAVPSARLVTSHFDPTRRTRAAFLRKILFELTFRGRVAEEVRIHPYTACALDPKSALVVLDTFGAVLDPGWLSVLARASIRRARYLATISRQEQRVLEAHFGRRFTLLTPFPHSDFFTRPLAASDRHATIGTLRVAYWGGWHPRKAIGEMFHSIVPSRHVHFYCTGVPPNEIAARADVTCVGRLSRTALIDLIDSAHVALYPSRAEGLGLPPYEALLRGRPVILRSLPCYDDYLLAPRGPGIVPLVDGDHFSDLLAIARDVGPVTPDAHLQTPSLAAARERLTTQVQAWLGAPQR